MKNYFFDENQIRCNLISTNSGAGYNWLFVPGGPGLGSEYFLGLLEILNLPGNVWLIDLPGVGSNQSGLDDDFERWFSIFPDLIKRFQSPILVGHSFGGQLPLLFPELEQLLAGFVILSSTPCLWMEETAKVAQQNHLPDLGPQMKCFIENPNQQTFNEALAACMPYYFPDWSLEKGQRLLEPIPFNFKPAVWWQNKAIQINFNATWIPEKVETLIIGAEYDAITPFSLFEQDVRFNKPNIQKHFIKGAGHVPWVEEPEQVQKLFNEFCKRLGEKTC